MTVTPTAPPVPPDAAAPSQRFRMLPAFLILVPVVVSAVAWSLPTDDRGLTGFLVHAPLNLRGPLFILAWLAIVALLACAAFSAGLSRGPMHSLHRVSIDEFHVATCVIGALGTFWIYWTVTHGSLNTLVELWTHQEFSSFRYSFDYGAGVSTGRYASVIAGGLSLVRLLDGRRLRVLDFASFGVLVATSLLNARITLVMAVASAAAVAAFAPNGHRVRPSRVLGAVAVILVIFVQANYSRNANYYESQGVHNPVTMSLINAHSYLATPTQVTLAVSNAALQGRAIPPDDVYGGLGPVLPLYLVKAVTGPQPRALETGSVAERYQGSVDLSLALTTNGAPIDLLMEYGWWALLGAIPVLVGAAWIAGRFAVSGAIGAAVAGALLYSFVECWRVYILNAGSVHFILLLGLGAVALGALRERRHVESSGPQDPSAPRFALRETGTS